MPSSLAAGPFFRFLNVVRRLNVKSTATIRLEPRTAPASPQLGEMWVQSDGKLYIYNGSAAVVVGTQA